MTELSPAAKAVLDASTAPTGDFCLENVDKIAAAALRAAADQVVPEKPPQATYEYCCDYTQHRTQDAIRSHFLAIATELENQ